MKPFGLGLVGVTHPHTSGRLLALLRSGQFEAVAGADESAAGAAFFKHFSIPQKTTDAVFDAPTIDAILICGASNRMSGDAIRALNRGKHVLVEKPAGQTVSDLVSLHDATQQSGKVCQVGYGKRVSRIVAAAVDVLRSGALGRVISARFHSGCSFDEAASDFANAPGELGGAFWIIGGHFVDVALHAFGMPLAVNARTPKFPGFKDPKFREDAVSATLSYANHIVSFDFNSWDPFPWNESWSISAYGTNGEMHASLLPAKVEVNLAEASAGYPAGKHVPFEAESNVAWSGERTEFSPEIRVVKNTEQFDLEIGGFLDAIRGGQSPTAKADDALNVARVIQACFESSHARGTEVVLPRS